MVHLGGKHSRENITDEVLIEKAKRFIRSENNINQWREFVSLR